MNFKCLKELELKTNLIYSSTERILYGIYNGYYIAVTVLERENRFSVISFADFSKDLESESPIKSKIEIEAKQFSELNQFVNYYYVDKNTIKASIIPSKTGEDAENIHTLLNHMTETLKFYKMQNCCSNCGDTSFLSAYLIDGKPDFLCSACHSEVSKTIPQKHSRSTNPLMGIVGALLGSLIGVIAWIVIFQLGYIAGLAGLIAVACAYKGYTLFCKSNGKSAIIISTVVAIVMLFVGHIFAWGIGIYQEISIAYTDVNFFDALRLATLCVTDPEVAGDFFIDLLLGYVFTIVASFSFIVSNAKNPKVERGILRLEY